MLSILINLLPEITGYSDICLKTFKQTTFYTKQMTQKHNLSEEILIALCRVIRAIDLHSCRLGQSHGLTGPQVLILSELFGPVQLFTKPSLHSPVETLLC